MHKHLKILACAALAVSLTTPVAAQDETPDAQTVVATVNGTEITLGHMIIARATLPEQYQQLPDEVLFKGILDQLVQQTALSQSFDGDLPPRVALSLENERRSLIAGEVVESALKSAVTEEAIKAAYDAKYAEAEPTEEYNASHILVESEEEAKAIKAELDGGADFAQLARDKSTGPSGPGGGSLGWFGPGMMVPSFEAATIALEPGTVSDPVETQFGWHVIKLNETRKADVPALDAVRAELEGEVSKAAVQETIDAVTAAADVDRSGAEGIDQSLLKNLDLLD